MTSRLGWPRLSAAGLGMRPETGGRESLLSAYQVCLCGGSAPGQLPELGVQVGRQPGAVFTLERA